MLHQQLPGKLWDQEPVETLRVLMSPEWEGCQAWTNLEHLRAIAEATMPVEGARAVLEWINDRAESIRKLSIEGRDEPD